MAILTLQATGPTTGQATDRTRARIPPFDVIELDLAGNRSAPQPSKGRVADR